jgi:excisionase family DNA binding protein
MDQSEGAARRRRFTTVRHVADILSVDDDDVETLLESGELPGIRIGRRNEWRIELTVLADYLDAKYEESRRAALFRGSDHASIADLDGVRRHVTPRAQELGDGTPGSVGSPG